MDLHQSFVSITQEADAEWIKRKRKINTETLIMEVARGKVNRLGLRQIASNKNAICSAAALVQAKQRISPTTLATVLRKMNDAMSIGPRILAIDSSKISLPLRFKAHGVAPRNDAARKPLIMCSTLHDVRLDIPLEVFVADHHNERKSLLEEHGPQLRSGDLVVGDRGYYSRDVCLQLKNRGINVLFRVKEDACREIRKFVTSRRNERIIDIDGMRINCFKYALCGQRYVLVTTDTSMTLSKARTIYKSRWRIEEGFRRWKSDFNLCKHVAHSLHTFKIDVLIVAIAHALVRGQLIHCLQKKRIILSPNEPSMHCINVRAFRACALALFRISFDHPWLDVGIWIPTRRAHL